MFFCLMAFVYILGRQPLISKGSKVVSYRIESRVSKNSELAIWLHSFHEKRGTREGGWGPVASSHLYEKLSFLLHTCCILLLRVRLLQFTHVFAFAASNRQAIWSIPWKYFIEFKYLLSYNPSCQWTNVLSK